VVHQEQIGQPQAQNRRSALRHYGHPLKLPDWNRPCPDTLRECALRHATHPGPRKGKSSNDFGGKKRAKQSHDLL